MDEGGGWKEGGNPVVRFSGGDEIIGSKLCGNCAAVGRAADPPGKGWRVERWEDEVEMENSMELRGGFMDGSKSIFCFESMYWSIETAKRNNA